MNKNQLMDQLAQHGYALMRPKRTESGEKLLMDLLRQDDARLLEGFPVVLADLMKEKEMPEWQSKKWRPSFSKKTGHRFFVMMAVSYSLFNLFGLKEYADRVFKLLERWGQRKEAEKLADPSLKSVQLDREVALSVEKLKNNFRNYVVEQTESADVEKKKHALELDLLLSELFTPRQKELLKKRAEGKQMTKTEREYFYRVVSKRLKALANEDLHRMARQLV